MWRKRTRSFTDWHRCLLLPILPLALKEDIDIRFLPEVEDAVNMSFGERNKEGFKMAMKTDIGIFLRTWKCGLCSKPEPHRKRIIRKAKTSFSELLQ